jgi:hypothetical protein
MTSSASYDMRWECGGQTGSALLYFRQEVRETRTETKLTIVE